MKGIDGSVRISVSYYWYPILHKLKTLDIAGVVW